MKPIAWFDPSNGVVSTDRDSPLFTPLGQVWPLYPKGEWVDLTDEEVFGLFGRFTAMTGKSWLDLYRMTEAKLKEKNT